MELKFVNIGGLQGILDDTFIVRFVICCLVVRREAPSPPRGNRKADTVGSVQIFEANRAQRLLPLYSE
jgi:hypothetical protein